MKCAEAVHAMSDAGVVLTDWVLGMEDGSPMMAFFDAIALADEQQVALPQPLTQQLRVLFDQIEMRPDSSIRNLVDETLHRVEKRAAIGVA